VRANTTLHYLTPDDAQVLLDDAKAGCLDTRKGIKVAFKAHAANLRVALNEARGRAARLAAAEPVCMYRRAWAEEWCGTKAQLRSIGVALDGPYPGEQGGAERFTRTLDKRGFKVNIARDTKWPGLYRARIKMPQEAQEQRREAEKKAEAERERLRRLKTLPATADKYRESVAGTFWACVCAVGNGMQAEDGYRFTTDAIEEFMDAARDAYWAIKDGETQGRSPREKLQRVLCANAKADASLQSFLSSLRTDGAH
jgi:hypothetical protein